MNNEIIYAKALCQELVPALGCTEPIAIAFAAAKAREVLGSFPKSVEIRCSGNIIKNVKGVKVPNSGGMRGVKAAAILGIVGGDPGRELQVLEGVTHDDIGKTKDLLDKEYATVRLQHDVDNLYIECVATSDAHSARVLVINRHTLVAEIEKDGQILFHREPVSVGEDTDWSSWSIRGIIDFAENTCMDKLAPVIKRQIQMNTEISAAGLREHYGAEIGRIILETDSETIRSRAKA